MRTFIAINFDAAVRDRIAAAVESFPVSDPPWRWTRPETWHITLKFLGELSGHELPAVERGLDEACARHSAFDLELGPFGGFPNLGRPRVLFFAAGEGAAALGRLAADVNRALREQAGIPEETRRFHAHVTLARIKSRLPRTVTDKLAGVPPLENAVQKVGSVDLMCSELRRSGAVYRRLKGFALPPAS
jgi:2'-5' RNA ligase